MLTRLEPADANGQRRKTINEYAYNGAWRVVRERTCLADAAGNSLTCGTAAEQVRQISYWQSTGLPLTETLTDGIGSQALTTTHSYNTAGRLLSTDGPLPGTDDATYYRYDTAGRPTWEIGPLGANGVRAARRTAYRGDDQVDYVEEGTVPNHSSSVLTVLTRTDIDHNSRRLAVREAVSASGAIQTVQQRSYDALNRLECQARRMNPGAFGSLPASACALGAAGTGSNAYGADRITRNLYDAEGRVLQEQRAYGTLRQQNYVTYTYSPNGQRTSVTDANGNRAELRYDGHDRQARWVFPHPTTTGALNEADYEAYTYDAIGNRLTVRKRDGTTLTFGYDGLNRMTVRNVPTSASGASGYSVHYSYDIGNRQTYARFGSASGQGVTNAYDMFGRLTSTTSNMGGVSRTVTYEYDTAGRRTRITHPDGGNFTYEHDAADQLTTLREEGSAVLASFSYDAAGRRSGLGYAGAASTYAYDSIGRLASLGHDLGGTGADQSLTFAYNPASQIVTRTSANDAYAPTSAYDVTRSYSVNGLNQYTTAGPAAFTYDANGNLRSDGSSTFVYDAENRLVSASGARTANLAYDPLGRLWQVSGGTAGVQQFLYDGDALIGEYNAAGTMVRRYAHGSDAGADDPLIWYEYPVSGWRRGLMTDHQGSVIGITDMYGNAVAINAYDAWGIPNGGNQGRFGYTGQIWLPELGMWHYKARIYSPTLGRFLQTDPVGYEDQINLYAYIANDPVNAVDPRGERIVILGSPRDRLALFRSILAVANASPALTARLAVLASSRFTHEIAFRPRDYSWSAASSRPTTPNSAANGVGSNTRNTINPFYRSGVDSLSRDLNTMIAHELFGHAYNSDRGRRNLAFNPQTGIEYEEHSAMDVENHYNRSVGRAEQETYGGKPLRPNRTSEWSIDGDQITGTRARASRICADGGQTSC